MSKRKKPGDDRPLTDEQIQKYWDELVGEVDSFLEYESDDDYSPSGNEKQSDLEVDDIQSDFEAGNDDDNESEVDEPQQGSNNNSKNADDSGDDEDPPGASDSSSEEESDDDDDNNIKWSEPDPNVNFTPRLTISTFRQPQLLTKFPNNVSELDVFRKFFPRSLILRIVQCTNERLGILNKIRKEYVAKHPEKKRKRAQILLTDEGEIQVLLGVILIMSYNHLPEFHDYWSQKSSLGNEMVKNVISRDRFCILFGKLYFTSPEKPPDASKIYYVEDMVECLRNTFQKHREDSSFQSIDESMAKFKGRSSLKQYMPMKPVKRGIKIWMRSDSKTGYVYDFDIYQGKSEGNDPDGGTLGERVVNKLLRTVKCNPTDVTLATDRFFTSVNMINSTPFPMVGTFMSNRKNTPKFPKMKMKRGHTRFRINNKNCTASNWLDCKEVNVLSNCHGPDVVKIKRKMKTGELEEFDCPSMTLTYNQIMGGVDLSDQKMSVYELGRKMVIMFLLSD